MRFEVLLECELGGVGFKWTLEELKADILLSL